MTIDHWSVQHFWADGNEQIDSADTEAVARSWAQRMLRVGGVVGVMLYAIAFVDGDPKMVHREQIYLDPSWQEPPEWAA